MSKAIFIFRILSSQCYDQKGTCCCFPNTFQLSNLNGTLPTVVAGHFGHCNCMLLQHAEQTTCPHGMKTPLPFGSEHETHLNLRRTSSLSRSAASIFLLAFSALLLVAASRWRHTSTSFCRASIFWSKSSFSCLAVDLWRRYSSKSLTCLVILFSSSLHAAFKSTF